MTTEAATAPSLITTVRSLLRSMRPSQWTKNAIVYAGLVFDGKLFVPEYFWNTTLIALCFCLVSSSVYLMNDLVDMEKDRQHPRKRLRALPSGQLSPWVAGVAAVLLALSGMGTAAWVNPFVGGVTAVYLVQNIAYSFLLKNWVIIDVMVLSLGFLLRVIAGVIVVQVANFSPWLYVCVTLLSLFLGFGKRRHELTLLADGAVNHRASLEHYNLPLLDQLIGLVTTSTLVAYTLYSFEAQTALAGWRMLLTVPFVFYFIARYLYLIHVRKEGGAPDDLLLRDRPLMFNSVLWAMTVVAVIYWPVL